MRVMQRFLFSAYALFDLVIIFKDYVIFIN